MICIYTYYCIMYNIMLWRKMERHGGDGYYMILQGIVVYSRLVEDK